MGLSLLRGNQKDAQYALVVSWYGFLQGFSEAEAVVVYW